jgi:soluble lytic murein transglycosylase-like protein
LLIRLRLNAENQEENAMRIFALILAALLCLISMTAQAAPPVWLVDAVIQIVSVGNPYAVFAGGKTHYPARREEALRIVSEARAAGQSYDLGLMQVNKFWIDKYGLDPASLFDPTVNRQWGTAILADEIARHGLTWKAVGKYHSPDDERGRLYAWKIYAAARKARAATRQ